MAARATSTLDRSSPIERRAPVVIRRLEKAYPDAHVALRFSNPLECLVATILSAQCTDEKVNEVTATLFRKYRSAEDYLAVPEQELKADIRRQDSSTRRRRRCVRRANASSRSTGATCPTPCTIS